MEGFCVQVESITRALGEECGVYQVGRGTRVVVAGVNPTWRKGHNRKGFTDLP